MIIDKSSIIAEQSNIRSKVVDITTMGGRIKEQRIKAKMTQEQLAEKMCITKVAISQYENNKVDIKGSVIVELARILGTSAGYLLNGEVVSNCMDKQMEEIIKVFNSLENDKIQKIALEQISSLASLIDFR